MLPDSECVMTVAEASQDFSQVAKAVDRHGAVVLTQNDRPRYVIAALDQLKTGSAANTDTVALLADALMREFDEAFEALSE